MHLAIVVGILLLFTTQSRDGQVLELGRPIERELAGGQVHSYQITLAAGQFMDAVVEQKGIDVVLTLFDPEEKKLIEVDSPNGITGPEPVKWVAASSGGYRLEVRSLEKNAKAARYEVKIVEVRGATEQDKLIVESLRLHGEAVGLAAEGKYSDAIPRLERALELLEKAGGGHDLEIASLLNSLALFCKYQGYLERAEALYKRALAIQESELGPEHPVVADTISNLAVLYTDKGDHARAEPLDKRALAIREKVLGPEHSDTAISLHNLGELYRAKGMYLEAEPLLERSLIILEKAAGDNSDLARFLNSLALLYKDEGDYERADPLFRRALAILEKTVGPGHPDLAITLCHVASVYQYRGDYAQAEPLYLRALEIQKSLLGPVHPDLAVTQVHLALLYEARGEYAKAEPLLASALAIHEKVYGPDNPEVAAALINLAGLSRLRGDYAQGERFSRRGREILEKNLSAEHPKVATSLSNLALLYYYQGEYAQAEPLQLRALAIFEKALGPEHPSVGYSLNNLAILYEAQGDYARAEPLAKRALAIREKAVGPDHPDSALLQRNLAWLYHSKGDYQVAEALYQRALPTQERALGSEHPDVAASLNRLALLYQATGKMAQAVELERRSASIGESNFNRNFATGSERQIAGALALSRDETDQILSMHARLNPDNSEALKLAMSTLLRRKGRALDAMSGTISTLRQRADSQDQALFNQLSTAGTKLASLTLRGPVNNQFAEYRVRLQELTDEVDKAEASLSARSAEFRTTTQPISLETIQAAIPEGAALLEFAVYRSYDVKTRRFGPARYVVYTLSAKGDPGWADLGEAAPIDRNVAALRLALRNPQRTDVKRLARTLDEQVLRPVRGTLGSTHRLLISPDGSLNLIPFAALVNEQNRYLVESYEISYLTSGRDLLRLQVPRESRTGPLVVANPAFGISHIAYSPSRRIALPVESDASGTRHADFSRAWFPPLPGTAGEAKALKAILPQGKVLTGEQATKTALQQANAPSILHIATHGFFLKDEKPGPSNSRSIGLSVINRVSAENGLLVDPLLRSGLALAGANLHGGNGGNGGNRDNGVLTAKEAAGLNLWGTKLVVLSACDTGVGEVKNGDGVYGLRRALVLAGSETQVMSLWPVSDIGTRDLMIAYYQGLQRGEGRSAAMRDVQLRMLRSPARRHPYYWASFIQSGEWASLAGKR